MQRSTKLKFSYFKLSQELFFYSCTQLHLIFCKLIKRSKESILISFMFDKFSYSQLFLQHFLNLVVSTAVWTFSGWKYYFRAYKWLQFWTSFTEIILPHCIAFCDTYVQQLLVSDPCGCPSFVGPSTFDTLRWEFQMQYFSIKFLSLLLSVKHKWKHNQSS